MAIEIEPGLTEVPPGGSPTHEPATLLANSTFMLLARAFTLASGGALIVYAARTFTVSEYGHYAVAVAMMAIFALLSELGISSLSLREMSPHDARRAQILGVALVAEIVTSAAAAALLVPVGLALGYPSAVLVLLALAAGVLLFQGLLPPIDATFKATRLLVYAAVLIFVQSAVTAAVGFTLVALGAGPAGLMIALLAGTIAAVPVGLVLLKERLGIVPSFDDAWTRMLPFLRASAPIAFTGAITAIYERVDVVMVSKLDSSAAAAIYSIPLTIVQYSLLVPAIIGTAFFPLFANTLRADPASARESFFLVSRLFLFASVPLALVLIAGGGDIVTILFGDRYHASGGVLLLLGWNVILGFQIFLLWYGLLAANREREVAVLMAAGLALNVGLNFGLIPVRLRPAREPLHLPRGVGAPHETRRPAARSDRGALGIHSRPARDPRKNGMLEPVQAVHQQPLAPTPRPLEPDPERLLLTADVVTTRLALRVVAEAHERLGHAFDACAPEEPQVEVVVGGVDVRLVEQSNGVEQLASEDDGRRRHVVAEEQIQTPVEPPGPVDPACDPVLVRDLHRAVDGVDAGLAQQACNGPIDGGGHVLVVAVQPAEQLASSLCKALVDGVCLAAVGFRDPAKLRIVACLEQLDGSVGRVPVDDEVLMRSREAGHAFERLGQITRRVVDRRHDRQHRPLVAHRREVNG